MKRMSPMILNEISLRINSKEQVHGNIQSAGKAVTQLINLFEWQLVDPRFPIRQAKSLSAHSTFPSGISATSSNN